MKRGLVWLATVLSAFLLVACGVSNGGAKTVATVEKGDNYVAITVEEANGTDTLLDVMQDLQAAEKLVFTADGTGMIQSIDGKSNAADWSACWLLYISDAELSNAEWGTMEYKGDTYGSAILGASALTVEAGVVYVWGYQST